MKKRLIPLIILVTLLFSCKKEEKTISEEAKSFLTEVISIMEQNSVNRKTIDWVDFRKSVFDVAGTAQTIEEAHPALEKALTLLDDVNCWIILPDGSYLTYEGFLPCGAENVVSPTVPDNVGYVRLSSCTATANGADGIAYAEAVQDQIREADKPALIGWIVDLRGSTGGGLWPILAGIGPVLGEGTAGYFIYPDNIEAGWGYSNGASTALGDPVTQLSNPYQLISGNPKVAVLTDGAVAIAGEFIAISFVGRPNSRSFGAPTCGHSTGFLTFSLSHNYIIGLTIANMADRNKNLYGGVVAPDVVVNNTQIIQTAVSWLEGN